MALFCSQSDEEVTKIRQDCPIPLSSEGWNYWHVWRTNRDNPTPKEIEDSAVVFLNMVLGHDWDNLSIHIQEEVPTDWAKLIRIINRGSCPHFFLMHPETSSPISIWLRFVWRGKTDKIGWPFEELPPRIPPACPTEADWLLEAPYKAIPGSEPKVPDKPTIIGEIIPSTTSPAGALTWGLLGAAAALGAIWVIKKNV